MKPLSKKCQINYLFVFRQYYILALSFSSYRNYWHSPNTIFTIDREPDGSLCKLIPIFSCSLEFLTVHCLLFFICGLSLWWEPLPIMTVFNSSLWYMESLIYWSQIFNTFYKGFRTFFGERLFITSILPSKFQTLLLDMKVFAFCGHNHWNCHFVFGYIDRVCSLACYLLVAILFEISCISDGQFRTHIFR